MLRRFMSSIGILNADFNLLGTDGDVCCAVFD
jgi:hypothetical protein